MVFGLQHTGFSYFCLCEWDRGIVLTFYGYIGIDLCDLLLSTGVVVVTPRRWYRRSALVYAVWAAACFFLRWSPRCQLDGFAVNSGFDGE